MEKAQGLSKMRRETIFLCVVVLLVVLLLALLLVACNPTEDETVIDERLVAVEEFKINTLTSIDSSWSLDMENSEVKYLSSPSSYIIVSAWLDTIGDILYDSSLMTGKITALADYMASEEGKELLSGTVEVGIEEIVNALSVVGFTSTETQEVLYEVIYALVDGKQTFLDIYDRLYAVYRIATGNPKTDAREACEALESINAAYEISDSSETLAIIEAAKEGIYLLIGFVYEGLYTLVNNSESSGISSIISSMNSGALADISDADAYEYLTSLLDEIARFRDEFTEERVTLLSDALGALDSIFGRITFPSALESLNVLTYLGDMKSAVDFIPYTLNTIYETVTELLSETDSKGDHPFIAFLLELAEINEQLENQTTSGATFISKTYSIAGSNEVILYARLLLVAMENGNILNEDGTIGDDIKEVLETYAKATDVDRIVNSLLAGLIAVFLSLDEEGLSAYTEDIDEVPEELADLLDNFEDISYVTVYGFWIKAFKTRFMRYIAETENSNLSKRLNWLETAFDNLKSKGQTLSETYDVDLPSALQGDFEEKESILDWYSWYAEVLEAAEQLLVEVVNSMRETSGTSYVEDAVSNVETMIVKILTDARDYIEAIASMDLMDVTAEGVTSEDIYAWIDELNGYLSAALPVILREGL